MAAHSNIMKDDISSEILEDINLKDAQAIQNRTVLKIIELSSERIFLGILLLFFSLSTVFGNTLVIVAVIRERYLHTATNYFITSLAFADCLVGLVVMPFSALYEVLKKRWVFTLGWCDIWRSLDVLFSTASILNLCVISIDRYWAIKDPFIYPSRMTRKLAIVLITCVWLASSLISFPAIIWWRIVRKDYIPKDKCPFTISLEYIVFSSAISFYLPLFVMVFTYYKIYREASIQNQSLKAGTKQVMIASGAQELTLRMHRGGRFRKTLEKNHIVCKVMVPPKNMYHINQQSNAENNDDSPESLFYKSDFKDNFLTSGKNFSLSRKIAKFSKEKKAAKTLGIVMGVFIICWLPFFVVNLWTGFCARCIWKEDIISAAVSWLGWLNSGMNPVIYACWSRDFRR